MPRAEEIYSMGFAVPLYGISHETRVFRSGDEVFTVPFDEVSVFQFLGWPVADLEEVRDAAISIERVN